MKSEKKQLRSHIGYARNVKDLHKTLYRMYDSKGNLLEETDRQEFSKNGVVNFTMHRLRERGREALGIPPSRISAAATDADYDIVIVKREASGETRNFFSKFV